MALIRDINYSAELCLAGRPQERRAWVRPCVPTQNGPICFVFLIPLAFFFSPINLPGASLLNKRPRLPDVGAGPDLSQFVTLFSHSSLALGFQVSPPVENA